MDWDKRLSLFIAGRAEGEDLRELLRIAERAEQFDDEVQRTVQKALDEVVGPTEAALSQWQTVAQERAEVLASVKDLTAGLLDLLRAFSCEMCAHKRDIEHCEASGCLDTSADIGWEPFGLSECNLSVYRALRGPTS